MAWRQSVAQKQELEAARVEYERICVEIGKRSIKRWFNPGNRENREKTVKLLEQAEALRFAWHRKTGDTRCLDRPREETNAQAIERFEPARAIVDAWRELEEKR